MVCFFRNGFRLISESLIDFVVATSLFPLMDFILSNFIEDIFLTVFFSCRDRQHIIQCDFCFLHWKLKTSEHHWKHDSDVFVMVTQCRFSSARKR